MNPVICERPRSELGRFEAGPKDVALLRIERHCPVLAAPYPVLQLSIPPIRSHRFVRVRHLDRGDVEGRRRARAGISDGAAAVPRLHLKARLYVYLGAYN